MYAFKHGGCLWLNILLVIMIFNSSVSVETPDSWKDFIKDVTTKFDEGSIDKDFHLIIPPRSPITEKPNPSRYLLPNLYLWDPLSQYPDVFLRFPFYCPHHDTMVLIPKQWTDGSTNALYPRVLLDCRGPNLLVTRNYYCNSGETRHYIRGTDCDLMRKFEDVLHKPFKLSHKYAFTLPFAQRLRDSASNGVSFNHFQANYMECQMQNCMEIKERFFLHNTLWESSGNAEDEHGTAIAQLFELAMNDYRDKIVNFVQAMICYATFFLKIFKTEIRCMKMRCDQQLRKV